MYYVYIHKTNDDYVFYVGKGNKFRPWSPHRNKKHKRITEKFGCNVEVVWETTNEIEAFAYEIQLISHFNTYTTDWHNETIACNFTLGGEGTSGHRHSEEIRKRQGAGGRGIPMSEKQKAQMKATLACKKENERLQSIEKVRKELKDRIEGLVILQSDSSS